LSFQTEKFDACLNELTVVKNDWSLLSFLQSGCRGWLRVFQPEELGHSLLGAELLRPVRQRRSCHASQGRSDLLIRNPAGNDSFHAINPLKQRFPTFY